ncbi:MAG: FHA domain-containing protein, partial [Deltaproteobacteria bacterium]|nr:FHA domain-containing protein [Nannocystaceae bacterium]
MAMLCLLVVAGPDLGRRIALQHAPITVGRGQTEALKLADTAVSRHHLTLRLDDDGSGPRVVVDEVAGVNPVWTLIDGQRVTVQRGFQLAPGGTLTLGSTTLQITEDTPAPAAKLGRSTVEIDAKL